MSENNIVQFGRYKGKPIEVMIADQGYCDWLKAQEWFRNSPLYQVVINARLEEPQDTPEHNEMVARIIDQHYGFIALRYDEWPDHGVTDYICTQEIEPKGGDLLISRFGKYGLVEIKPTISDDYPSVIRQVKTGMSANNSSGFVIAGSVRSRSLTLDQIRRQFTLAGIKLVLEDEFFANQEKMAKNHLDHIKLCLKEEQENLKNISEKELEINSIIEKLKSYVIKINELKIDTYDYIREVYEYSSGFHNKTEDEIAIENQKRNKLRTSREEIVKETNELLGTKDGGYASIHSSLALVKQISEKIQRIKGKRDKTRSDSENDIARYEVFLKGKEI